MNQRPRWIRTIVAGVVGIAVLVLVLAWLSGAFVRKTPPGNSPGNSPGSSSIQPQPITGKAIEVQVRSAPRVIKAVGTVRAVHETAVGSQLMAKVHRVRVVAGQSVKQGEVLVELDKSDLEARLSGAKANVDAAQARLGQTRSDLEKVGKLHAGGAATTREFEDATRAAEIAAADLLARQHALEEVQAQLNYAMVTAPITGTVIDKAVEEGDMARPGQTLVTLYDPGKLQLVASVPERLAIRLKVGQEMQIELDAIGQNCQGTISEIVPQSSAAARSMTVKVTGACPAGVVSGMFGRLLIPEGQREQLTVPAAAVHTVGQLEMVQVVTDGSARQRLVRTGEHAGDQVEVLSGLAPGEKVLVP